MAESPSLYLARLELDTPWLFRLGRGRRLPAEEVDLGYLVHLHLMELFGPRGPQPFVIPPSRGRSVEVLGYTAEPKDALQELASAFADPAAFQACHWERAATKPLPVSWGRGRVLGFQARLCPVVRMNSESELHRKGAEVDVFVRDCWRTGDRDRTVDREAVYREWLAEELGRRGGAKLQEAKLHRFQRTRLLRRTGGKERKARVLERPDATMQGCLEVTDDERFTALLRRGLGRHRGFGFGMLLLRRPGRV